MLPVYSQPGRCFFWRARLAWQLFTLTLLMALPALLGTPDLKHSNARWHCAHSQRRSAPASSGQHRADFSDSVIK